MALPRLYAIVDAEVLAARGLVLWKFAEGLVEGGARLVQYRNKTGTAQEMLRDAVVLRRVLAGTAVVLIFNDRADLAVLAGFDGVHVGQGDLSPEDARLIVGVGPLIGVSTHTVEEALTAEASCADYVAVGPVFATGTKRDAAAVVGLEGVRAVRAATGKPLVAIGGITLENAQNVVDAGADSVAVISGLVDGQGGVAEIAREFLGVLSSTTARQTCNGR